MKKKKLKMIVKVQQEGLDDLQCRVRFLLDTFHLWSPPEADGHCYFTFPDGDTWTKDEPVGVSEPPAGGSVS
jgi:hypothetical protein